MKKILALLLALSMMSACSSRTAPTMQTPTESPSQSVSEGSAEVPKAEAPSETPAETPSETPSETPAETPSEKEETPKEEDKAPAQSDEEKEASDDDGGTSASGVFKLLDSGYEINLQVPFMGVYDSASNGLYISAQADPGVQGIVSYTSDASEVKAIEDNITVLNETLKNDASVKDFQYEREKDGNGLYSITFSYRTEADEVSSVGYNYVLYRQTEKGMITVMFSCKDNKYAAPVETVFDSVVPAGADAVEPPSR